MKYCGLIGVVIGLLITTSDSYAQIDQPWQVGSKLSLPNESLKDFGVGIISNDIVQDNISITIRKVRKKLTNSAELPEKGGLYGKRFTLKFNQNNAYSFVRLPEGTYQIIEITVPHYDLPAKLAKDKSDSNRFEIVRGQINYIGSLKVNEKRATDWVSAVWLNQFAKHYQNIVDMRDEQEVTWPIGFGIMYKDRFAELLVEAANKNIQEQ